MFICSYYEINVSILIVCLLFYSTPKFNDFTKIKEKIFTHINHTLKA